ncbi:MAG: ATP synthase subunit I [Bryobacteraceae bacterium]
MGLEGETYRAALRRIDRYMAMLALAGTLMCAVQWGWPGAGGFAFGIAASWLNFRWIKKVAEAVGGAPQTRRATGYAIILGLRYLLLGGIGYVILKFFGVNLLALLAGLLSVVAAVIFEALYQLFTYA